MPDPTPKEKLKIANDDFHEAAEEVLLDDSIELEKKVIAATMMNQIFTDMKRLDDKLNE